MSKELIGALCARSGRLDQRCRSALSGIPGVGAIELTPQPDAQRGAGLSLSFKGWSPSLHAAWTVAYEPLPDAVGDEDEVADAMGDLFEAVVARQRARAADADALGHVEPLRNGNVAHLQMDRAIADIYMRNRADSELVEFARSTIGSIHGGTTTHSGGATLGRPGQMVGEGRQADGTALRYVAPKVKIYGTPGRMPAVFTGHHLRIHTERLPETVLCSLVGRPLSDLVSVHPDLDARTIRMAENDGRPDAATILIGLDQHLDPLPAEA